MIKEETKANVGLNEQGESRGFSSRGGLILTLIGAAIGTGNIWRFPREVALNGGGAFIFAWTVLLVAVAVPLAIAEMVIGRSTRHGVPGAFKDFMGKNKTWMGIFMTLTVACIASYYTVVMAWILRYFILAVTQELFIITDKSALFDSVANNSWLTAVCFIISLLITGYINMNGVSKGIERVQKINVPLLLVLLLIVMVRALTLPGAVKGLEFIFRIDPAYLFNGTTWLRALIQILWSVGVGWGLVICYAVSTHAKSDVALNSFIQGFSDNATSILAAMAILPVLFSMFPLDQALAICASGNNGLTFISLTGVFAQIPGGRIMAILFFAALFLAGLSSNIGHFLVPTTALVDCGISRKKATLITFIITMIWGLPSALNIKFMGNQDFVSGTLLIIGILFTCYAITKFGTEKIRKDFINIPENDIYVGKWFDISIKYTVPAICLIGIGWSVNGLLKAEPSEIFNIFATESLGTLLVQLVLYFIVAFLLANTVNKYTTKKYFNGKSYPEIPDEHK